MRPLRHLFAIVCIYFPTLAIADNSAANILKWNEMLRVRLIQQATLLQIEKLRTNAVTEFAKLNGLDPNGLRRQLETNGRFLPSDPNQPYREKSQTVDLMLGNRACRLTLNSYNHYLKHHFFGFSWGVNKPTSPKDNYENTPGRWAHLEAYCVAPGGEPTALKSGSSDIESAIEGTYRPIEHFRKYVEANQRFIRTH